MTAPQMALAIWIAAMCVATGCDRAPSSTESAGATAEPGGEGAAVGDDALVQAGGGAAEVASDRYPGLMFELLDAVERTRFVGLASAELCPCTGTVASMDTCLQSESACELALQAGAAMMRLVKEGASDVEVTDGVQQFIANARRVWTFELDDTPWSGAADPKVVIVVFSDFECPHCRELARTIHSLLGRYGDHVRVYYKQFPLASHRNASAAAVAALAAHQQGQFVVVHDLIFERQVALQNADDPTALLVRVAEEAGLNLPRFAEDASAEATRLQMERDRREGMAAGLLSTPTVFFDGVKVLDGHSLESLTARIEARLAALGVTP